MFYHIISNTIQNTEYHYTPIKHRMHISSMILNVTMKIYFPLSKVQKQKDLTYMLTPGGGSQTHSPVVRLAYMRSFDWGSIISTHSHLKINKNNYTT